MEHLFGKFLELDTLEYDVFHRHVRNYLIPEYEPAWLLCYEVREDYCAFIYGYYSHGRPQYTAFNIENIQLRGIDIPVIIRDNKCNFRWSKNV